MAKLNTARSEDPRACTPKMERPLLRRARVNPTPFDLFPGIRREAAGSYTPASRALGFFCQGGIPGLKALVGFMPFSRQLLMGGIGLMGLWQERAQVEAHFPLPWLPRNQRRSLG